MSTYYNLRNVLLKYNYQNENFEHVLDLEASFVERKRIK